MDRGLTLNKRKKVDSFANNETNPCHYSNVCREDNTCVCSTGSSGILCHQPPTGHGHCDEFFNFQKFNYDGDDCCIHTCTGVDYNCGKDTTGNFFVGYEQCRIKNDEGYRQSAPLKVPGDQIDTVHISSNGKFLVVILVQAETSQFYDLDGSRWYMRGATLRFEAKSDQILQISSMQNALITTNPLYNCGNQ